MIGEFRLHARLGSGGMGRVFLASSPGGRAVAVKVVHPHLARDGAFLGRFRREVAAALVVNGGYAAPVIAAGPDDSPPWLATAYVPGPSLQEAVTATGPLPEDAVLKLAAGLAEALRVIHHCGLVHRDLKPGNVLLAAPGAGPADVQSPPGPPVAPAAPAVTGPPMGRRRALAALAGMVTGGLAMAGWELAHRGKPSAGQLDAARKPRGRPGQKLWRFAANGPVEAITVHGGTVYAGTGHNTVFALDAVTGRQRWRRATTRQFNDQLAATPNAVFIADTHQVRFTGRTGGLTGVLCPGYPGGGAACAVPPRSGR